jgi:hypothetical protein
MKFRVIIEEVEFKRNKKIQLLKNAILDPIFNADIEEIKVL